MDNNQPQNYRQIFNSPIFWGIVGVIGVIASIIIPYFLSKQKREVSYRDSTGSVFNLPDESLKLYFRDSPVSNVSISDITIYNSGNQPIKSSEISDGINVIFNKQCRILSASAISSSPSSAIQQFRNDIRLDQQYIIFKPTLFNATDNVSIRVITSGCTDAKISVSARIEGIKEIIPASSKSSKGQTIALLTGALIGSLISIFTSFRQLGSNKRSRFESLTKELSDVNDILNNLEIMNSSSNISNEMNEEVSKQIIFYRSRKDEINNSIINLNNNPRYAAYYILPPVILIAIGIIVYMTR